MMGLVLMVLADQGAAHLASGVALWRQALVLFALIAYGVIFYFTLIHITGTQRLGLMMRRLRRRG